MQHVEHIACAISSSKGTRKTVCSCFEGKQFISGVPSVAPRQGAYVSLIACNRECAAKAPDHGAVMHYHMLERSCAPCNKISLWC